MVFAGSEVDEMALKLRGLVAQAGKHLKHFYTVFSIDDSVASSLPSFFIIVVALLALPSMFIVTLSLAVLRSLRARIMSPVTLVRLGGSSP
jgi:hypothetical protein